MEKSLTKKCYGITEGRTDGKTDERTDGMTDRCKPVYPHFFQSGDIIPKQNKKQHKQRVKRAAGIEGQVAARLRARVGRPQTS